MSAGTPSGCLKVDLVPASKNTAITIPKRVFFMSLFSFVTKLMCTNYLGSVAGSTLAKVYHLLVTRLSHKLPTKGQPQRSEEVSFSSCFPPCEPIRSQVWGSRANTGLAPEQSIALFGCSESRKLVIFNPRKDRAQVSQT